jgi:hypothetical protein
VIKHGYDGIDGRSFAPIIRVDMADQRHTGWVQVPAEAGASQAVRRIDRVS